MAYIVPMHVKPKFTYLLTYPWFVSKTGPGEHSGGKITIGLGKGLVLIR